MQCRYTSRFASVGQGTFRITHAAAAMAGRHTHTAAGAAMASTHAAVGTAAVTAGTHAATAMTGMHMAAATAATKHARGGVFEQAREGQGSALVRFS